MPVVSVIVPVAPVPDGRAGAARRAGAGAEAVRHRKGPAAQRILRAGRDVLPVPVRARSGACPSSCPWRRCCCPCRCPWCPSSCRSRRCSLLPVPVVSVIVLVAPVPDVPCRCPWCPSSCPSSRCSRAGAGTRGVRHRARCARAAAARARGAAATSVARLALTGTTCQDHDEYHRHHHGDKPHILHTSLHVCTSINMFGSCQYQSQRA